MNREILLGDEAVGLGAIHAGISGVYGYPGTPSTEIFEFVERRTKKAGDVHAFWSTNEKVAYEEALGMSWAGKRALVCMKHVGLNVAADAFMNSARSPAPTAASCSPSPTIPGMHSSQNEQDSRYFAQFALIPCFEPRNQQECYDMMFEAFELSEELVAPGHDPARHPHRPQPRRGRRPRSSARRTSSTRQARSRSGPCCRPTPGSSTSTSPRSSRSCCAAPRTAPHNELDLARQERHHRLRSCRQLPPREPRARPRLLDPLHPPVPAAGGQGPHASSSTSTSC